MRPRRRGRRRTRRGQRHVRGLRVTMSPATGLVALLVAVGLCSLVLAHLVAALLVAGIAALVAVLVGSSRTKRRSRARVMASSLAELVALTPGDFERAVGHLLNRDGWHLAHSGGTGDNGADLIGTDPNGAPVVVQAKRYAGSVGSPVVRDLAGAVTLHRATYGVLATTGRMTPSATETAQRCGVVVLGPDELAGLSAHAGAMSADDPRSGNFQRGWRGSTRRSSRSQVWRGWVWGCGPARHRWRGRCERRALRGRR